MPNVAGRGHGDLFVSVKAQVPKKLTKEQRKLVEELRRTMDDAATTGAPPDEDRPFFERVKDIFG